MTRRALAAVLTLALAPLLAVAGAPGHADARARSGVSVDPACSAQARWQCRSQILLEDPTDGTDAQRRTTPATRTARIKAAVVHAYSARQLQAAYGVSRAPLPGPRRTIAVVDAFDYPSAASDLAKYRRRMGLPACTVANKCLRILNQNLRRGPLPKPAPRNDNWTVESALDLDAASALCPRCRLVLVEAANDLGPGLMVAAHNASRVAHYVSLSWGGNDFGNIPTGYLRIRGTIYTAASGDYGHESNPDVPSTLSNVVSVGGVTLTSPHAMPTAWSGAGSSCSRRVVQPAPQGAFSTGCSNKASSDISALANPRTGMAVYDTGGGLPGWISVGGTSAASPIVAALYATVGNRSQPWAPYAQASTYPSLIRDVVSGSNGSCGTALCHAGTGWDGPTGIGMPRSPEAVALPLRHLQLSAPRLVAARGRRIALTLTLPATVHDTGGMPQPLSARSAQVTGLPAGLTATSESGGRLLISGTPTTLGAGSAQLTLHARTRAGRTTTGSATLRWSVTTARLVPSGHLTVRGTVRQGSTVRAGLPTLHAGSATGPRVRPAWRVTWLLRGKVVHTGRRFTLPAHTRGAALRVRARALTPGFPTHTYLSNSFTIR